MAVGFAVLSVAIRDILPVQRALSRRELTKFGEKVRALRTRRGLTLKRLAASLGMDTHSYLSELESGKKAPSALLALRLARLFEVSTDTLLLDEVELDEEAGRQ